MNGNLRSKTISLLFNYRVDEHGDLIDSLWGTLRRNAVEPGQAFSPHLNSFADDCLLCAQIVTNVGCSNTEQEDALENFWDRDHASVPATSVHPSPANRPVGQIIGIIYLYVGPANLPAGEANVGVIINPNVQRRGYAREALQLVLRWAFEELKFHRVQAAILDTQYRDRAMRLFIGMGFSHEGTKRRAVYQPEEEGVAGTWKDVTYLAMLDTEWVLRSAWKRDIVEHSVISVWDEMFARHAREREELVRWEEKQGRVRRSSSTETLRENHAETSNMQDLACLTDDDATSFGILSLHGSTPPSPKLNIVITSEQDEVVPGDLGDANLDQRWEEVRALQGRWRRQYASDSLLEPSTSRVLALPSIPSTHLSDANLQSPLTIPSPTTPAPISPPPPSPTPSSSHDSWTDSGSEARWLFGDSHPGPSVPVLNPNAPQLRISASLTMKRSRSSSSSSSSSTDTWSDAQSSIDIGSNGWDVVSNSSSASHRGY